MDPRYAIVNTTYAGPETIQRDLNKLPNYHIIFVDTKSKYILLEYDKVQILSRPVTTEG